MEKGQKELIDKLSYEVREYLDAIQISEKELFNLNKKISDNAKTITHLDYTEAIIEIGMVEECLKLLNARLEAAVRAREIVLKHFLVK